MYVCVCLCVCGGGGGGESLFVRMHAYITVCLSVNGMIAVKVPHVSFVLSD